MAYSDFKFEDIAPRLGLNVLPGNLFPDLAPVPVPSWLPESLARGRRFISLGTEKARSEVIVVPILLAAEELVPGPITIYSGQRLDADPGSGLVGECDYILSRAPTLPIIRAPLLTVVEAKKADIELGLGQCIAQMEGAKRFNAASKLPTFPVYGCVTSGIVWQFLRMDGMEVVIDTEQYSVPADIGRILGALQIALAPR